MRVPRLVILAALLAAAIAVPAQAASLGYHPSSVLVTFEDGTAAAARDAAHAAAGGRVATRWAELNTDVVSLPDAVTPLAAVDLYEALPGVARVALNKRVQVRSSPNDLQFGDQWGFNNTGQTVTGSFVRGKADFDIDAPEAWTIAFGAGSFESTGGTRVAVLDTGIDRTHVELVNKVKACAQAVTALGVVTEGSCSDDNLHGTHTAGTVAASTNNTAGVAGTAPNAELAIFKFLNGAGVGFLADEIAAIRWTTQKSGAKVASMSFGSYESDSTEQQALRDAANAGILLVAAAGNDGDSTANYPASYSEVMSVASTSADDDVSSFSNCNSDVEVGAPGEDIWSTFPGNGYGVISGTSMATPHVAGAAALVMSEKGLSASQTRSTLTTTATDVTGNDGRSACTSVRQINLAAALGGGGTTPPPPTSPGAIAGRVIDSKSKVALASATVNCGTAGTATTGTDGRYTLSSVPAGTYSCTASKSGYQSKSASVSVISGATSTADFALRRL